MPCRGDMAHHPVPESFLKSCPIAFPSGRKTTGWKEIVAKQGGRGGGGEEGGEEGEGGGGRSHLPELFLDKTLFFLNKQTNLYFENISFLPICPLVSSPKLASCHYGN